jgi:hypothetical protein
LLPTSKAKLALNRSAAVMRWPKLSEHPRIRFVLLVLYYFAIIASLLLLYGRSGFSTPPFVYQGF